MKVMEAISVYPSSKEEATFIIEFLSRLKVPFQAAEGELKDWQIENINKGLDDIANGRVVSFAEVSKKAKAICSQ